MAENTKIEWTDHTFNPWMGCTKIAAGCQNCYAAEQMDHRWGKVKWGASGHRVRTSDANWRLPLKWNAQAEAEGVRRRVFCASLADVFEDWGGDIHNSKGETLYRHVVSRVTAPLSHWAQVRPAADKLTMYDLRNDLFELIDQTPHLDWLLVTKRPENIFSMWPVAGEGEYRLRDDSLNDLIPHRKNVWLLTSVSDQETAERNIPELLKCRDLCPVLGVSAEPLLGPVNLWDWLGLEEDRDGSPRRESKWGGLTCELDWVIIGGESGPGARPFYVEHGESLLRQCRDAGVPAFMKQIGAMPVTSNANLRDFPPHVQELDDFGDGGAASCRYKLRHAKGGDPDEWPEDLRVRQFPTT